MTFPTITYKYNGIEDAKPLAIIMDQKLQSLEKYLKEDSSVICEVEFEKLTAQQSGRIYRAEVNLTIDGTLYRAEATEDSFEKAIDEVRDEVDKELRRAKDKQQTLDKQAGREMKERMLDEVEGKNNN